MDYILLSIGIFFFVVCLVMILYQEPYEEEIYEQIYHPQ